MDEQTTNPQQEQYADYKWVPEKKNADSKSSLNLYLIISNVILFLSVIVLFVLFFTRNSSSTAGHQASGINPETGEVMPANLAFVRSDSLMKNYELAIKMRNDLEEKQKKMEAEFSSKQRAFQSEVESFQRSINAGTISIEQAEKKEKELMQRQQDLMELNQTLSSRLAQQEFDLNVELLDSISNFLERYNRDYGFDFILGYTKGGQILYASGQKDITSDVIKKLNESYLKGKK